MQEKSKTCGHIGLIVLTAWISACGASDEVTEPLAEELACAPLDQQIPTVIDLLDTGQLAGVRKVIEEGMGDDLRGQLLELALQIIRALPPGTVDELQGVIEDDAVYALLPVAADLLRFVTEDGGKGHYEIVPVASNVLQLCEAKDLLRFAGDVLEDPVIFGAIELILSDPEGLEKLFSALHIDLKSPEARAAVLALLDNVLASFVAPGFGLEELEDILADLSEMGLVDLRMPAIRGILSLAHEVLDRDGNLLILQDYLRCVRTVDADSVLVGFLYDLIASGAVKLDAVLDLTALVQSPSGDVVMGLLVDVIDFLVGDDEARVSLAEILLVILQEDSARLVLPDLVVLLDEGALPEVADLLVAILYGCGEPAGGAQ